MPAIDGIVSGLDTTSLINSIIGAAATPRLAMESQREDLEQRRERVAALSARFADISTAIGAFDESDDWNIAKVTSGDNTAFEATVDDDAALGTYAVTVNALAKSQTTASAGYADRAASGTIAHGNLDVTIGGVLTSIPIDGTNDSLGGLALALNDLDGITAFTIDTGDSVNPWKLVIQADETGDDGSFTIDTSGLTGGTGTAPVLTDVVTASNASVTINGIDISSSSNLLTDILPGVDLQLKAEGGAPESLTVGEDREGLVDLVDAFVTAYNKANTYYDEQSFFNAETGNRGPLAGDGTTRRAISKLGSLVSNSYTVAGSTTVALAELGFKTNRDGSLEFDRAKFEESLSADFDGVKAFLISDDGPMAALRTEIDDVQVDATNGALTNRIESLKESVDGYDERIEDFQKYLDSYSERLRSQFNQMEVTLGRLQSAQSSIAALFAGINSSQ
jgi:flagellar hook-associated protein 2